MPAKEQEDLKDRFDNCVKRSKTTKAEAFLVRTLSATAKTPQQQVDAIKDTMAEHAKGTKSEPEGWFFRPLLNESQRFLAANAKSAKVGGEKAAKAPPKAAVASAVAAASASSGKAKSKKK